MNRNELTNHLNGVIDDLREFDRYSGYQSMIRLLEEDIRLLIESYECELIEEQGWLVKYNKRATELLEACVQLFNKQLDSPFVLNLLDELIYYDDCECDGNCLMEDIRYLLEYGE